MDYLKDLGIEAISRGAKEVVFVDKAKESVELTKKNLAKIKESAEVFFTDALAYLKRTNKKFDIIFIDPPYADDVSERAVELIMEKGLLTENGVIMFERDKPFIATEKAAVFKEKKYGKAYITFIRSARSCLFAGTFDPVTVGHSAVIECALKAYDKVFVVVMNNEAKKPKFSLEDRLNMLRLLFGSEPKIIIDKWNGMLVDYMKNNKIIYNVRGIRNERDIIYEKEMEEYNSNAYPEIIYDYIYTDTPVSSTDVRELLDSGGDVSLLVDKKILKYITELNNAQAK